MEQITKTTEQTREEIVVTLSEDVLVEILARLPVKSLMRFKCVCKSWHYFISDSAFIRKHFLHYTNNLDNSSNLLVVGVRYRVPGNGYAYSLISSHDDSFPNQFARCGSIPSKIDTILLKDFRETDHSSFSYLCHGFGIVCFRNGVNDNVALWKPTTGEFRILPDLPQPICISPYTRMDYPPYICCGLGFDSIHKDYKLVHFGYRFLDYGSHIEEEPVSLYSFNTNSWKILDVKFNGKPWYVNQRPTFINGFHWWLVMDDQKPQTYDDDIYGYDFIASFDGNAEMFRYYHLPECCRDCVADYYRLIQLRGSVALCLCPERDLELIPDKNKSFDIWLMEEFGAEVTWTKIFSIGPFQGVDMVVASWPSSNIIVIQLESNQLLLYDLITSETVHFNLEIPMGIEKCNVHVFSDSLVHVGGRIDF